MTKQAHTPAPWFAASKPSSVVGWPIVGELGSLIADVCTMANPGDPPPKEARANARLIAAAPDLLAALEHIVGGALSLPRFAEEEARAAIAKARGEA